MIDSDRADLGKRTREASDHGAERPAPPVPRHNRVVIGRGIYCVAVRAEEAIYDELVVDGILGVELTSRGQLSNPPQAHRIILMLPASSCNKLRAVRADRAAADVVGRTLIRDEIISARYPQANRRVFGHTENGGPIWGKRATTYDLVVRLPTTHT